MFRMLLAAVAVAGCMWCGAARADELLIIANSSVYTRAPVSLKLIAAIYLLRVTAWPDGTHIIPVNREAASPTRVKFTARVLRQDNDDLAAYWNEMHYLGKLPPVVQESDEAMLAFVRNVPGAVGYISASSTPPDVKVLAHVR